MKCFQKKRARHAGQNAIQEDFRRAFTANLDGLYQLSFLLTGNHEEAEQCFVTGLEDSITTNNAFKDWVHSWAKHAIIENAVCILRPHPEVANSSIAATSKLPSVQNGHFALESVLALADFERFVFVLSVLEQYTEHECAVFLGCSQPEIGNAQRGALEKLAEPIYTVSSDEAFDHLAVGPSGPGSKRPVIRGKKAEPNARR